MHEGELTEGGLQRSKDGEQRPALAAMHQPTADLLRLEFKVALSRPLHLPFTGSALRGAFGHALKALTDYLGTPQVYAQIFDAAGSAGPEDSSAAELASASPAYVISPPVPLQEHRHALCFGMTLLGAAAHHVDVVEQAWRMVFLRGLGAEYVTGVLTQCSVGALPQLQAKAQELKDCQHWQLCLTSPVFIKHRKLQAKAQPLSASQMQWEHWLRALHRRIRLAHLQFGSAIAEPEPFEQWLQWQSGLQVRTDWQDVGYTRHSQRQQKHIPLSGVVGAVHLVGRIAPGLLHALLLGQWLHAGSKTALGMGSYTLQALYVGGGDFPKNAGLPSRADLSTLMH